jgi:hypothetical protein
MIWSASAWATGETVVTYSGSPSAGSKISVEAAPGKANRIRARTNLGFYILGDPIGVVESSPYCTQESPTEVRCQLQGLQSAELDAGDRADRVLIGKGDVGQTRVNGGFGWDNLG